MADEQNIEDNSLDKELADAWNADNDVSPSEELDDTTPPANVEVNKENDSEKPKESGEAEDEQPSAADPQKATPTGDETPKDPEAPQEVQPLTRDDMREVMSSLRAEERAAETELKTATEQVIGQYYPQGLSNVLIDKNTGKPLRSAQDVIDATDGEMTPEQAQQWLMNEQAKLDESISKIKNDAAQVAETTVTFKREAEQALTKYAPLFEAYPHLQNKVFTKLMKQVRTDEEKGLILSSPDVMEFYDDALEPYQLAYEQKTNQPATNPINPQAPPSATPGTVDRLDEGGDGGATTQVDDPNDFAQQVNKELSKGI